MTVKSEHTAAELTEHRRKSPIGTGQRHYHVQPEYVSTRGGFADIVLVPGSVSTYIYIADEAGDIADFDTIGVVAGTDNPEVALSQLGYQVAAQAESAGA